MRSTISYLFLIALMLVPNAAFANITGFRINFVVAWDESDTECAAEGEITSIEGEQISGAERLAVNGVTWGDFSGLPNLGYSAGDKFAFGTASLQIKLGYNFDVLLDEGMCKNLLADDDLSFDGSFGAELLNFKLLNPVLRYGQLLDKGAYVPVDLSLNSLQITNLDGASILIGNGPVINEGGGGNSGGGCALGVPLAGGALALGGLLITGAFLALIFRRPF